MRLLKSEEDYYNFRNGNLSNKAKILIKPTKKGFVRTLFDFENKKEYNYYYKAHFEPIKSDGFSEYKMEKSRVEDTINSYIITKGKCLFEVYLLTEKEFNYRLGILNRKLMLRELIK